VTAGRLGSVWDGRDVEVRVFSANATAMAVCLFETADASAAAATVPMSRDGDVWSARLAGGGPGLTYGLRAEGPWAPGDGHWFDPDRPLFDPYGRAFAEVFDWAHGRTPRAVVINDHFDWGDARPLATPWSETLIYELHVKGFTARHPAIDPSIRGTYAALASAPAIAHLQSLGVTAVELLPVHARVDERALFHRGLTNYWGYNTLGYFAPEPRLAAARTPQGVINEFKAMVRALHAAGIEVLLDVVYNHTAEGDHVGATMSFRGLDNASYYRLQPGDRSRYEDFTGCGNTLDLRSAPARQLVLDSLRYWATEMRVDGFRFDLASALARGPHGFDPGAQFFEEIKADPVLRGRKLIAEPWDATADGYRLGGFPAGWVEWNGRFRDDVRRYWRGDAVGRGALATRLAGSSDLFGQPGRGPLASVNFVTAHDGFTMADLVSYADKHNDANGEDNRDGESHNLSDNHGVEGPTDDPGVMARRQARQRDFFTTLFAALGVPMISGGDELGRSQRGNNNAYCQDNGLSWTPWRPEDGADLELLAFVQDLAAWRRATPSVRRNTFFAPTGHDVAWLHVDGVTPLSDDDWRHPTGRAFIMRLTGPPAVEVVFDGQTVRIAGVTGSSATESPRP
jgi:isoamylase